MAEAANKERTEMPNENYMFAGADPIQDEDQGAYDPDLQETVPETTNETEEEVIAAADADQTAEETTSESTDEPATDNEATSEAEDEAPTKDVPADTEDTAATGEPDEPERSKKETGQVPSWRLAQEAAKRRQLEKQLKEMQSAQNKDTSSTTGEAALPQVEVDTSELERKYVDLVLDGKTQEASQVRAEINQKIQEATLQAAIAEATKQAREIAQSEFSQKTAETKLDSVIDGLEEKYEFLRPNTEATDEALIGEIQSMYEGYVRTGFEPHEAMQKAADNAIKLYRPEVLEPVPADPEPTSLRQTTSEAAAAQRRKEVERNVTAQKQQPPELPASEQTNDPYSNLNADSMSEEEFDALPESVKRRARGDFL